MPRLPWDYDSYVLFTDPCYASVISEAIKTYREIPPSVARTWSGMYKASTSRGELTVLFPQTVRGIDCTKIRVLSIIPVKYVSPLTLKLPDFDNRTVTIYPSNLDRSAMLMITDRFGRSFSKELVLRPFGFEVDYRRHMLVIVAHGSTRFGTDYQTSILRGDRTTYFVTFVPYVSIEGPVYDD